MRLTGKVEGDAALRRKLKALGEAAAGEAALRALEAGGDVIAARARQNVDVRKGELRQSIGVGREARFAEPDPRPHVFVGPDERFGARASWEEEGTMHQAPDPFLRPALDAGADEATRATGARLREEIGKRAR